MKINQKIFYLSAEFIIVKFINNNEVEIKNSATKLKQPNQIVKKEHIRPFEYRVQKNRY
jgi:hypothetical protein